MKILILGSGSFAGQAVFSNLLKEGFDVIGLGFKIIRLSMARIGMWQISIQILIN